MNSSSNIAAEGLHVYDGHIRDSNFEKRKKRCDEAFNLVMKLKNTIESVGLKINTIVAGGTPSFPIHSKRAKYSGESGHTIIMGSRIYEFIT